MCRGEWNIPKPLFMVFGVAFSGGCRRLLKVEFFLGVVDKGDGLPVNTKWLDAFLQQFHGKFHYPCCGEHFLFGLISL